MLLCLVGMFTGELPRCVPGVTPSPGATGRTAPLPHKKEEFLLPVSNIQPPVDNCSHMVDIRGNKMRGEKFLVCVKKLRSPI